jgi:hypothetical protein
LNGHQFFWCRRRSLYYHYLLVVVSRKLCLFVCYAKHVGNRLWVVKGVASMQWRREVGCSWKNIRSGVWRKRTCLVFCCWNCYNLCKRNLQKFLVDVWFLVCQWLCHGRLCVLVRIRIYKGLMLRDDDP